MVLCVAAAVQAEVIILKNGTVMRGRIVEKTPEYIVLRSGEGATATRATIFFDDINRIETEEEFEKRTGYVPLSILEVKTGVRPVFEKESVFPLMVSQGGSKEHIMELVAQEQARRSLTETVEQEWQSAEAESSDAGPSFVKRFTEGRVHLLKPNLENRLIEVSGAPKQGHGRISGEVSLPADVKGASGDLFVYLMEDAGGGNFISAPKMLFDKIDAADIRSAKVRYTIEDVPAGHYKVFAQWDIARPAVKINTVGDNISLAYLGAQGDYSGMTKDALTLAIDELRENVNFSCATFIEEDRVTFDWGQKPLFRIVDIYYQRNYPEEMKFFLLIRNPSRKQIDHLPLDIYINDKKIFSFPWEFKNIPADGEKEFDVSQAYQGYIRLEGEDAENILKFSITFAGSKEKEFEKIIYVFK